MGKIARGDLPAKPECVVKTTELLDSTNKIGLMKQNEDEGDAEEYGGWTIENARQRLNRFCMTERISCDFQNHSEGPCHSKVTFVHVSYSTVRLRPEDDFELYWLQSKKTKYSTLSPGQYLNTT